MFTGYFDNSVESLLSFMVKEQKLGEDDIKKIREMIDKNSKK
jgi:predicted transcriptional regulator